MLPCPKLTMTITRYCLEHGVAVLGEKPMAANLEEARDLVRAVRANFDAVRRKPKPALQRRVGRVQGSSSTNVSEASGISTPSFTGRPHFGGFREEMDSPLLIDMAIHTFDAARYVTGADPVSVQCTEFNPPWSWYRGAASAVVEFELTERDPLQL